MERIRISKADKLLQGRIQLDGSKSISNRALIIQALCKDSFTIDRLAQAQDTQTMQALLKQTEGSSYDVGPAGTTFRFLTAYFATKEGTQLLTGSERMLQRPIGKLVDALRRLGATISYVGEEGYPPLQIDSFRSNGENEIEIEANTSSQFISALLLIAPHLENGLDLKLSSKIVSRPYIEMTLGVMKHFGIEHDWTEDRIQIKPQAYQAKDFTVEADWSAASYYYGMAALSEECSLDLEGLFENSFQGDAIISDLMSRLGVVTTFHESGIQIRKKKEAKTVEAFEQNFLQCPDLAQTLSVSLAGLGIAGVFSGLETLFIKETDRVQALKNELAKVQVYLSKLPARMSANVDDDFFMQDGKATFEQCPRFATYEDHRMAMSLAILSILHEVEIEEPDVVGKSYPAFWDDLLSLRFEIQAV